jgi:hypothetical protein
MADALSATDQSAKAIIREALAEFGLDALADWAWGQYTGGSAVDTIMLDLRERPEYKTRFPAMENLAKAGHAITESQYLQYEQSVAQVMRANGIPEGFYAPPDAIQKFLEGNVSVAEIQSRVQAANAAIYTAGPETQAALNDLYGAGASPGQMAAWFLDPNRAEPLIAKEWAASQAAGQAALSGFGALSRDEAEFIANQGVSQQGLQQGFSDLQKQRALATRQVGAHTDAGNELVDRHSLLGAAFAGDADAQQRLANEAAQRKANQEGVTGFVQDQRTGGYTGLGTAPQ